jgi:hypothetical protein
MSLLYRPLIRTLQPGQALLIFILVIMFASLGVFFSFSAIALNEIRASRVDMQSRQGYYLAEAAIEDATWRLMNGKQWASTETLSLHGASASIAISGAF